MVLIIAVRHLILKCLDFEIESKTLRPTYSEQRMWTACLEGQYKTLGAGRPAFIQLSDRYSQPEKLIQSVLCSILQERRHRSPASTKCLVYLFKQNCGVRVTWWE